MKLCLVVGTRPQIIKSVPLIRKAPSMKVIHTGQHYDREMSADLFDAFGVPEPDVNLGCKGDEFGDMATKVKAELLADRPDAVIIPGDTNSALAGALAASKAGIPVAHMEAGARCYNPKMQEEVNRRVIDHISSWLFPVSAQCREHLWGENVAGRITTSGDTMCELLDASRDVIWRNAILERSALTPRSYVVLTLHRAEKTEQDIIEIYQRVKALGKKVVFPAHPRFNHAEGVKPLDYFSMMKLVQDSCAVFTDSGGLQKEAFWLGVPCVTLRDETEWMETIDLGWNRLGGMTLPPPGKPNPPNPYMTNGLPSEIILRELGA